MGGQQFEVVIISVNRVAYKLYTGRHPKVSGRHVWISALLLCAASPLLSQDLTGPRLRLRFPVQQGPSRIVAPAGVGVLYYRTPAALIAASWATRTRQAVEATISRRRSALSVASLGLAVVQDSIPIPRPADLADPEPPLGAELAGFADLGLDAQAHFELRFDQLRNARCTAGDVADPSSGCRGGFPTPTVESQFQVRAGGIVSDRLNVNVDFDSEREFNVNNDIRVWYQGLEGEFLQRVEVGNVTFRAPPSQFINSGIPSNSFGLQVEAQAGNLELRSIFAQQRGSAVRTRTFLIGETATQPSRPPKKNSNLAGASR